MSTDPKTPTFAWVERAAQRRKERLASPPVNVVPPKPVDRPAEEPSMITADEVRAIVREEIQAAFKALAEEAGGFPGYETDTIEDSAAYMLQRVAEGTAEILRHTATCKRRNGGTYYGDCDCGVKD